MNFKKIAMTALAGAMLIGTVGCANKNANDNKSNEPMSSSNVAKSNENTDKEKKDLVVFAAASMTEALEELKTEFEKENPNLNLTFNFDSSGTLKTQIDSGADCDVFVSAAQKQMDELEDEDKIDKETRFDLLENEVTLAVAEGNEKGIKDFKDLEKRDVEKIALGNSDVPVGQYSEEILKNLGIWDKIQDKVTFGSNVKEVTSWVSEKAADCGIVYKTDAKTAGLETVAVADDSMLENKVIYPAALLKNSKNPEEGKKYLEFLQGKKASEVLDKYGFKPLSK
ncbi:molybdate ABC transporter substrate-binding protein [Anaerococcus rubeinfantis]|uniref:molybdate ABC transporter substrate-binding protein n=1 Tax=Anaerococcus rubeinfantis TaxID=1720199 RepID=UPI00073EBD48|nr:molybdate ABC transporter substrate-binding protein [Anaerococcus rubeinfantis]